MEIPRNCKKKEAGGNGIRRRTRAMTAIKRGTGYEEACKKNGSRRDMLPYLGFERVVDGGRIWLSACSTTWT